MRLPATWGHRGAALAPCAVGGGEGDRWTAMRYGRGAQIMVEVLLSVFVGRGVRVGVPRRRAAAAGRGWHGRR